MLDIFLIVVYFMHIHRRVEQLAARRAHNPEVVGSSPTPAKIWKGILLGMPFFIAEVRLRLLFKRYQGNRIKNIFSSKVIDWLFYSAIV